MIDIVATKRRLAACLAFNLACRLTRLLSSTSYLRDERERRMNRLQKRNSRKRLETNEPGSGRELKWETYQFQDCTLRSLCAQSESRAMSESRHISPQKVNPQHRTAQRPQPAGRVAAHGPVVARLAAVTAPHAALRLLPPPLSPTTIVTATTPAR